MSITAGLIATLTALSGSPADTSYKDRYIAAVAPLAQRVSRSYHVPASVAIAQSVLESDWGRSLLTATDRNYFGIKCLAGWRGPIAVGCRTYTTREKRPVKIRAQFRVYASALDSFRDYGRLLNTPGYRGAQRFRTAPERFVRHVAVCYAVDPHYADHVILTMRAHDLYRFDRFR